MYGSESVNIPIPVAIFCSTETDQKQNVLMLASSDEFSSQVAPTPSTSLGGTLMRRMRRN